MLMQRGMAQLPDLHVSDSSEAMLSGRKPPFRLLVRAVATDGRKVNIRHAVSEGFVVRCLPACLITFWFLTDALCHASLQQTSADSNDSFPVSFPFTFAVMHTLHPEMPSLTL